MGQLHLVFRNSFTDILHLFECRPHHLHAPPRLHTHWCGTLCCLSVSLVHLVYIQQGVKTQMQTGRSILTLADVCSWMIYFVLKNSVLTTSDRPNMYRKNQLREFITKWELRSKVLYSYVQRRTTEDCCVYVSRLLQMCGNRRRSGDPIPQQH